MPNSDPQIGDVYYYPYIWQRQIKEDGEDAVAEKYRPCCVAIRLPVLIDGVDVYLLSISTKDYFDRADRIVIPPEEIALINGLDPRVTSYLTVCEYSETIHNSPVFSEMQYRGTFSINFMKNVVTPKIRPMLEMAISKRQAGK
ncbi:hypothetical protein KM176_05700 [Pseudooceanicola sp. CBS1P-1]|uniref:Uncharacterized protein n=1 Tax=Pseudooceanicola albus TaxID=2692189 RepID=A0A6L7FYG1_9RHOB|nr:MULTISPECIES: hypothetical protein [Pseudooceanicola]MBT9383347.1 hypothetical protein [Pseudooceanicola endophyticus]MXN16330.1 hypothetical protein [Pseudooceanicola albus]